MPYIPPQGLRKDWSELKGRLLFRPPQGLKTIDKWIIDGISFDCRQKITITEQSGNDLTDYQIPIELYFYNFEWDSVKADGSDIRFYQEGVGFLDYWIEKWDYNNYALIWVKIPSIPANSTIEIWMYYGNPDLTSEEVTPELMFEFYDSFDRPDSADVGNGWIEEADIGSIESNLLKILPPDDSRYFWHVYRPHGFSTGSYIFEVEGKFTDMSTVIEEEEYVYFHVFGTSIDQRFGLIDYPGNNLKYLNDTGAVDSGIDINPGRWYKLGIALHADAGRADYYFEGKLIASNQLPYTTTITDRVSFGCFRTAGESQYFDNFRIRKYTYPEPLVEVKYYSRNFVYTPVDAFDKVNVDVEVIQPERYGIVASRLPDFGFWRSTIIQKEADGEVELIVSQFDVAQSVYVSNRYYKSSDGITFVDQGDVPGTDPSGGFGTMRWHWDGTYYYYPFVYKDAAGNLIEEIRRKANVLDLDYTVCPAGNPPWPRDHDSYFIRTDGLIRMPDGWLKYGQGDPPTTGEGSQRRISAVKLDSVNLNEASVWSTLYDILVTNSSPLTWEYHGIVIIRPPKFRTIFGFLDRLYDWDPANPYSGAFDTWLFVNQIESLDDDAKWVRIGTIPIFPNIAGTQSEGCNVFCGLAEFGDKWYLYTVEDSTKNNKADDGVITLYITDKYKLVKIFPSVTPASFKARIDKADRKKWGVLRCGASGTYSIDLYDETGNLIASGLKDGDEIPASQDIQTIILQFNLEAESEIYYWYEA